MRGCMMIAVLALCSAAAIQLAAAAPTQPQYGQPASAGYAAYNSGFGNSGNFGNQAASASMGQYDAQESGEPMVAAARVPPANPVPPVTVPLSMVMAYRTSRAGPALISHYSPHLEPALKPAAGYWS